MIAAKMNNQNGETLVETLFAVIVAVFSLALLLTAISVTSFISVSSVNSDDELYSSLVSAESQQASPAAQGSVTIQEINGSKSFSTNTSVDFYGNNEVYSYKLSEDAS